MLQLFFSLFIATTPTAEAKAAWQIPDFQIAIAAQTQRLASTDCRAQIRNIICLVDPPQNPNDTAPRACLQEAERYALPLEEVYDLFPKHLQKMFCHLSRINVEKNFIGSAYGGLEFEPDMKTVRGGLLGIRESLLKGEISLNRWASWKEQVHFGTDPLTIEPAANLPQVIATRGNDPKMMLYFLVAHEFGHIFDFVNHINDTLDCADEHCPIKPGTFGAISFARNQIPLPQFEFPLRSALCFYFCEGKFIDTNLQDELYRQLAKSNFATPYATRYEQEDFADTFALYTLRKEFGMNYVIRTATGGTFDVMARLNSPDLQAKRDYIENFLNSRYRYPEAGRKLYK